MTQKTRISMLVITGLSGAGKTTLIEQFLRRHKEFRMCKSFTTRKTHDGEHYTMTEPSVFAQMLRNNEFIEAVRYPTGEYYGTPVSEITAVQKAGYIPLLDINTDGLMQIMKNRPADSGRILSMFIMPKDAYTLKQRLLKRHRESYEEIIVRLKAAFHELDQSCLCSGIVLNDTFGSALAMMEYLYMFPHEGFGADIDTFRHDLKQIIEEMENPGSLSALQEKIIFAYGESEINPYEEMERAMHLELKDFLREAFRIVLASAYRNDISLREAANGKND